MDVRGLHGLSCSTAAGKGNNLIHRALASANYHCILEPTGLYFDKKRPDGFSLYPYAEGKILAWDYTLEWPHLNSWAEQSLVVGQYSQRSMKTTIKMF